MTQNIEAVVLCDDPLIIFTTLLADDLSMLHRLAEVLKDREVTFFALPTWTCEEQSYADDVARLVKHHLERSPLHACYIVNSTEAERAVFRRKGVKSVFVHQNALVDPAIYNPPEAEHPIVDAIYIGALADWKRHELCSALPSVGFIYYPYDENGPEYLKTLRRRLPQARFFNEEILGERQFLSPAQVAALLGGARVGLCLSEREGPMLASVEYLLAGLPVVSTPSIGGRDFFFHPDFSAIAEPTPDAVARAVEDVLARAPPRHEIRSRTIDLQRRQIDHFVSILDAIVRRHGGSGYSRAAFEARYRDKLRQSQPFDRFVASLPTPAGRRTPRERLRRLRKKTAGVSRMWR